jgi:hypothetical protein
MAPVFDTPDCVTATASFAAVASPVLTSTSSERLEASIELSPLETLPMTCPPTPSPDDASPSWSIVVRLSPLLVACGGA